MRTMNQRSRGGFSLIELVIVVVIIGIIGAIAIPRMSRGAAGASDKALVANLSVLRNALDLYATEHGGTYPPAPDAATIELHLTGYSNAAGTAAQATQDTTHIYGPYLRAIPPLPVGSNQGNTEIQVTVNADANTGWIYDPTTGEITANTGTDADASGTLYTDY